MHASLQTSEALAEVPAEAPAEAPACWRPRQLLRRALLAILPRTILLVRGVPRSGDVYLTFDDGPHPEHTPRVLDVLREHGTRATFFVIGENAQANPDLTRRIVAEGHLLAHHSFAHTDPARTPARQLLIELDKTQEVFRTVAHNSSQLFRPPHGKLTLAKLLSLWRRGFTIVLWNRDSKDYARRTPEELSQWLKHRPLAGGDIVLMHDTNPHTPRALAGIIESTRSRGLTFRRIDRLLPRISRKTVPLP
jgi:peptidoglycan/xylan/chitin deacetylase (PgdA/CDA1 family)